MTVIKLKLREFVAIVCSVVAFHLASASPTVKEFDIWGNGNELIQSDLNRNESKVLRNGRVLNFFPIPVEEECLANDRRRRGKLPT